MTSSLEEVHLPRLLKDRSGGSLRLQAGGAAVRSHGRAKQKRSPTGGRAAACCPPLPHMPSNALRGLPSGKPSNMRSIDHLGRTCEWLGAGARTQSCGALHEERKRQWWPGYGEVTQKPSPLKRLTVRRDQRRHLADLNRALDLPFIFRDLCPPGYSEMLLHEQMLQSQPLSPGWMVPATASSPSSPSKVPARHRQAALNIQAEDQLSPGVPVSRPSPILLSSPSSFANASAPDSTSQDWARSSAALHQWAEGLLEGAKRERAAKIHLAPLARVPAVVAQAVLDIVEKDISGARGGPPSIQEHVDASPTHAADKAAGTDRKQEDQRMHAVGPHGAKQPPFLEQIASVGNAADRTRPEEFRVLDAFRSVAMHGEVSYDNLSKALQVVGHPNPREDWIEDAAASVSTSAGTRSFFDKADFMAFVAAYEDQHWSHICQIFDDARQDAQGRVALADVVPLLQRLDVSPMPGAITELADEAAAARERRSCAERVDLEHFSRIYEIGALRAGFTCREHDALHAIFNRCCRSDGLLDSSGLIRAMWMDRGCIRADADVDASIVEKAEIRHSEEGDRVPGMSFRSFLAAMRARRVPIVQQARVAFDKLVGAHTVQMASDRLLALFESLGFVTASPEIVHDAVRAAGLELKAVLTFEDVFRILQGYSESYGLSRTELQQIETAFREYDRDGSGGIDPSELRYVVRCFGYPASYEHLLRLMEEFDKDGSRELEHNELAMLVSRHREKQITKVRDAFTANSSVKEQMEVSKLRRVLLTLGYTPSDEQVARLEAFAGESGILGLWDLVRLVDELRSWLREALRANQGFTGTHLHQLKRQFEEYDPDYQGFINPRRLIEDLESEATSCKDAHRRATDLLRLGVQGSSGPPPLPKVSKRQSQIGIEYPSVDFNGFLRMMRAFQDRQEYEQMQREQTAVQAIGFSWSEVLELRQLHNMFDRDASGQLSLEELVDLLSGVVPCVSGARAAELRELLARVDEDGNRQLDFVEFLRLVKLVQDTDWNQINERAEEAVQRASLDTAAIARKSRVATPSAVSFQEKPGSAPGARSTGFSGISV